MLHRSLGATFAALVLALCGPAMAAAAERGTPARTGAAAAPAGAHGLQHVRSVEGVDEYRLANGLQLLLVTDGSKPTASVNLVYRVGSRHESYGETGMAHLLEHLLFKGTPKHPAVWTEFNRRGLAANGSTSFDRTNYTASFAADSGNLAWYLGWLSDAMVNSFIARKDLDTEMTVVRNEMERGENSPGRILYAKTLAAMYEWHNYGKMPIGARSDVENVDIPRLQAFYRRYYQPDNATLIVSGRFDTDAVLKTVAASFGPIPKPKRPLEPLYTLDPAQDGERNVTLRRVGGVPMLYAGYHAPAGAHPDFPAMELISLVMGDSPSGRLHKRLVETGLAASASGFASALADPGFALFSARLNPAGDIDRATGVMLQTIEQVAAEPISSGELERARRKWLNGWEQQFSDPEAVGQALGEAVAQGDWRLFFLSRDRIARIERAEVQRVAEQRLVQSNRTLATYIPTDRPQRPPAPQRADVAAQLEGFTPRAGEKTVAAFEATPEAIERRTVRFEIGGVRAAVLPKPTRSGTVDAVLTLRFGDERRLFGRAEAGDFLAAMLDKGTETLSRQQVQDRLDELRTEIGFSSGPGRLTVSLQSRRETLPAAIELLGQMLRRPQLSADVLDELKRQAVAAIELQRKEPAAVAANAVARWDDPYPRGDVRHVRSFDEQLADVQAMSIDRVRQFHADFYGADHAEFGAAGDIDLESLKPALQQALGDWRRGVGFARIVHPFHELKPIRLVLDTPDKQNATLIARQAFALNDDHPDYPAMSMANYLFGSGGSSRLWKRIRETEGLSYDVRSSVRWAQIDLHSEWRANAIFAPQNRAKVEAALREELERLRRDGFTAAELADGKRGLLGFRRLGRAQDAGIAAQLANNLYLGRTFLKSAEIDRALETLTPEAVSAAARRYLDPQRLVIGLAGDFKE